MIPVEEALAARRVTSGFLLHYRAEIGPRDPVLFPRGVDDVDQFAFILAAAPVYTWARPIQRVVDAASASYPLAEALESLHYFHQPSMFWLFEDALFRVQPPGEHEPPADVDAILIVPYSQGTTRTAQDMLRDYWAQVGGTPEERARIVDTLKARVSGVMVTAFSSRRTGRPVPLPVGMMPTGSRLCLPVMQTVCTFGEPATVRVDDIVDEQQTDPTIFEEQTRLRQWVLAAAALLKQRILVPEKQVASRGERKRLDALQLDTSVLTIQLRATQHAPTAPGTNVVEWSHRWIVRGHWRQQWYPSDKEHRVLWIPPYIKGPEDAPLQVRPAVYAVSR